MIDFAWLKDLNNVELQELIESATHICIERDKELVRKHVEEICRRCIAIENLHTHVPVLNGHSSWIELAEDCEDYLASL